MRRRWRCVDGYWMRRRLFVYKLSISTFVEDSINRSLSTRSFWLGSFINHDLSFCFGVSPRETLREATPFEFSLITINQPHMKNKFSLRVR